MLPGVKFPGEEIVRAGSIVPCILTHGVLNALSVFALEPD